jgi:sugar O-acyltransferase (sialic acid O-acetyltransferase NeuD family)
MKNLIFVCAGGFFLELLEYVTQEIESNHLENIKVKGFIDDAEGYVYENIDNLGSIVNYIPQDDDIFIIALGSPVIRSKIYLSLKNKGASFFTYVHSSSWVSPSAEIGEGTIICPFVIINANAKVSTNVAINVHASVGHEAIISESCVLSPYAAINGNSSLGAMSFMGTRTTIFPNVNVGSKCIVDTHSYVKVDAEDKTIISLRSEYKVIKNRLI